MKKKCWKICDTSQSGKKRESSFIFDIFLIYTNLCEILVLIELMGSIPVPLFKKCCLSAHRKCAFFVAFFAALWN